MDSDLNPNKIKRQKRIGQKQRTVNHNKNLHDTLFGQTQPRYEKEPHRLAEYNGMSCTNPDCMGCRNPRKFGELTMQERKFYQDKLYNIDEPSDDSDGEIDGE